MKATWKRYKLHEVCTLINGRAYSKPELLAEGKYPVLRVGNFFTNNHWYYSNMELDPDKYCDNGDLLYAWSASFGPRIWMGGKVIFHYHIWKVQPDPTLTDKRFLFTWFLWDTERIKEDQGTGTTMLHVAKGSMEDRDILLPPLPEQHRIVNVLDEAFEGIATAKANAEKNLQNARAIFESHLHGVFAQRGEGWMEKRLEQIGTTQTGSTPKTAERDRYGSFISFIKPSDFMADGSLCYENAGLSEKGLAESRKVAPGSVLMVCIGATIGKCGYCDQAITTNQQINAFTPFGNVSFKFIYYQMLTQRFRQLVLSNSGQATLPIINKSKWSALTVALPPELEVQMRIASKLEALREETQRLESLYQRKLVAIETLKKSLLHQAFTGNL